MVLGCAPGDRGPRRLRYWKCLLQRQRYMIKKAMSFNEISNAEDIQYDKQAEYTR